MNPTELLGLAVIEIHPGAGGTGAVVGPGDPAAVGGEGRAGVAGQHHTGDAPREPFQPAGETVIDGQGVAIGIGRGGGAWGAGEEGDEAAVGGEGRADAGGWLSLRAHAQGLKDPPPGVPEKEGLPVHPHPPAAVGGQTKPISEAEQPDKLGSGRGSRRCGRELCRGGPSPGRGGRGPIRGCPYASSQQPQKAQHQENLEKRCFHHGCSLRRIAFRPRIVREPSFAHRFPPLAVRNRHRPGRGGSGSSAPPARPQRQGHCPTSIPIASTIPPVSSSSSNRD
jgi:hypothetical protein